MTVPTPARTREYVAVLVVIAAASALAWWSTSATWAVAEIPLLGETDGSVGRAVSQQTLSAAAFVPVAAAMPIVGFAALAGILGSRGIVRRIVGAVLMLGGTALAWSGLSAAASLEVGAVPPSGEGLIVMADPLLPFIAAAGGVVLALSGLATLVRAARWPALGSNYERSAKVPRDAWEALDRGIDPTDD